MAKISLKITYQRSPSNHVLKYLKHVFFFFFITLYTKNVKQIKNTTNSAPIAIYFVEGKLNVKKK